MDTRYRLVTELTAGQHGAISTRQLEQLGIDRRLRSKWKRAGVLEPCGTRSWMLAGQPPSWLRVVWCAQADVDGHGFVAGRSAARLLGLDGFCSDAVEMLVPRSARGLRTPFVLRSTAAWHDPVDTVTIHGIRCLTAERTILTSPLFGFSKVETENAIDSAIRRRVVSEQRLRTRAVDEHRQGVNGSRQLLHALVDSGGESRLERWFLAIVRRAGLPRPDVQRVVRDGTRTVARLDALFPGNLVVEVEGHATHSSRRQRQADESRRSELILQGFRVVVFTYNDVRDRPEWVAQRLRRHLLAVVA